MAIERNVEVGGIEYFCPIPVAEAIDKYRAFYINSIAVTNLLDRAHCALRRIDAGDQTKAFSAKDLDAVSDAIEAIEEFCRERKLPLSEFGVRT